MSRVSRCCCEQGRTGHLAYRANNARWAVQYWGRLGPFGGQQVHQNALKCLKNRLCVELHSAPRFFRHFGASPSHNARAELWSQSAPGCEEPVLRSCSALIGYSQKPSFLSLWRVCFISQLGCEIKPEIQSYFFPSV